MKAISMKKKIVIVAALIFAALLIPIPHGYDDGGTVEYKAALYSVTKWHALAFEDGKGGCMEGTEVRVLFFEVYNDVEFKTDSI